MIEAPIIETHTKKVVPTVKEKWLIKLDKDGYITQVEDLLRKEFISKYNGFNFGNIHEALKEALGDYEYHIINLLPENYTHHKKMEIVVSMDNLSPYIYKVAIFPVIKDVEIGYKIDPLTERKLNEMTNILTPSDKEIEEFIETKKEIDSLQEAPTKFIIEVRDLGSELEISNPQYSQKVTIDYDNEETYFKNILSVFPNFGIIQFRNMEGFDLIELSEFKRS